MSGILFFGSSDFALRQGEKGQLLCLTYENKGLTLVLFYSNHCQYCDHLIKKFKQLPHIVNGCHFAMVNVSKHSDIPERSKNTMAAITYVPDLILYVNGNPYVRYDGAHEIQSITNFIIEIYKKIQQINFFPQQQQQQQPQQQYSPYPQQQPPPQQQQHQPQQQPSIPAYTVGKPVSGDKRDKVCYLNFNTAYTQTQTG